MFGREYLLLFQHFSLHSYNTPVPKRRSRVGRVQHDETRTYRTVFVVW